MTRRAVPMVDPICSDCATMGEAVDSSVIYPDRPDLHGRTMWRCPACKAYVGSHPGTDVPLGYPAGPETRALRSKVHAKFDPLWEAKMRRDKVSKGKARDAAYRWLAEELGIPADACHVSHFDADRCRAALAIIDGVYLAAQRRAQDVQPAQPLI